jgi:hypothetical protein
MKIKSQSHWHITYTPKGYFPYFAFFYISNLREREREKGRKGKREGERRKGERKREREGYRTAEGI